MEKLVLKVDGLDCAEEVAILKRALAETVPDENALLFDVLNGKLTIQHPPDEVTIDDITDRISKTGMRARPWSDHVARGDSGQSFWSRHGRATLCAVSGAALAGATLYNAASSGIADAFWGDVPSGFSGMFVVGGYALAIVSGAWYVAPKAWFAARNLSPDMNLLMMVAIAGAIGLGEWFEAATVAFLFAFSLVLESWSVGRARKAIGELLEIAPRRARYRCPCDGDIMERDVTDVPLGAVVVVRPGERLPLDGTITTGDTTVNEAPITGESRPVPKAPGDTVYAGSINHEGAFEFEVTHAAEDTTLARIIQMVEEAQSRRAPAEQWVDTFARRYTPAMMALAVGIAIVPPLLLGAAWAPWFYQSLVVLVIACPCALVISTPVSVVAGLAAAARNGILIKGGAFLEMPARVRAVAFDKTGTITLGQPIVRDVIPFNGHTRDELIERAAALEARSEHPVAAAVVRHAKDTGVSYGDVGDFQAIRGKGAEGTYGGKAYWIGSHRFLHEKGLATDVEVERAQALETSGQSFVAIGNRDHVCGLIGVADEVRPETEGIGAALRAVGVEHVCMLTGDNEAAARDVAATAGVDDFQAGLLPDQKLDAIHALTERYDVVAMVGDGINDAPAMAAAQLGIAMGAAGSDTAIETADIALMADDLRKLPWLIGHSRRVRRIIKQNVAFALGLKAVFIILTLFGVASLWLAILADMGASLLVIFNGLRLLRT